MAETEKKVGIPESISINGVTYVVKDTPELQQFIQEVARVEKTKLYSQYETLRNQISNLSKVQITEGGGFDVDTIVEKLKGTFITKKDLQEVLPGIVKEVVQPVLTATEQNRQDELKQYREKLIADNIATCIPELVKGETKEELDKSLQESIRLRASYPTPSTFGIHPNKHVTDPLIQTQAKEMEETLPKTTPTPQVESFTPAAPTPPAAPRRPSMEVSGTPSVKTMSMSEFAKQRESLQAQLEATYGGGSL